MTITRRWKRYIRNLRGNMMDKELEEAHLDYEKRKKEIQCQLKCVRDTNNLPDIMRFWVDQAIKFMDEREI